MKSAHITNRLFRRLLKHGMDSEGFLWNRFPEIILRVGTRYADSVLTNIAASFNASNSEYLDADTAAISAYPFTFTCWFKKSGSSPQTLIMVCDKDSSTALQRLWVDGNGVHISAIEGGTSQQKSEVTNDPDDGNWHFAAFVSESATSRWVKFDSNASTLGTINIPITSTYDRTCVGYSGTATPGAHFNGEIQNAAIWSAALTSVELEWLRNGGNGLGYTDLVNNQGGENVPAISKLSPWWPLNEQSGTRRDSNGTLHIFDTNTVTSQHGHIPEGASTEDHALTFDGINQSASAAVAPFTGYPAVASVWAKRSGAPGANEYIFVSSNGSSDYIALGINSVGRFVALQRTSGGTVRSIAAGPTITDGNWHHCVVNFEATRIQIWADLAGPYTSATHSDDFPATANSFSVGSFSDSSSWFTGSIDELSLYSTELQSSNRATLYSWGVGTLNSILDEDNKLGAVQCTHWWNLNSLDLNGAGRDKVGSMHLTLNNSPTDALGIPVGQAPPGTVWQLQNQQGTVHLAQSTISLRPEYVLNVANGLSGLLFDGVDDLLSCDFGADISEPHDTWIVFKLVNTSTGTILDGIDAAKEQGFRITATPNYEIDAGTPQAAGTPNTDLHIGLIRWGATDKLYIDGGAAVISAAAGTEVCSGLTVGNAIGGAAAKKVYVFEVIKTNAATSISRIAEIGKELSAAFGTTWSDVV